MQISNCGYGLVKQLVSQKKEVHLKQCFKSILQDLLCDRFDAYFFSKKCCHVKAQIEFEFTVHASGVLQLEESNTSLNLFKSALQELPEHIKLLKHPSRVFFFAKTDIQPLGGLIVVNKVNNTDSIALSDNEEGLILHLLEVYFLQLKLLHSSAVDPLSQLLNRQSFEQQLTGIIQSESYLQTKKVRSESRWFLAMLDIDHFKKVNDNFGHVIGDEVIVLVSQLLKSHFRFDDLLFRYGGEEFAILFSTESAELAWKLLDRARELVANTRFPQVNHVTMSVGFIQVSADFQLSELVDNADKALYFSKDNGRNQVTNYQQLNIEPHVISDCDIELF
ncbi:hypothetical protein CWB72_02775 [Pseudoalteromonas phenolica]|uniref:GGDEF domain-containing protein n=1 Tax=Pseudoalteromonas phenolica TaxID=161398 RepID=UPI00110BE6BA|nr:GGDEF domain-containing protein [Pseudoalteromonas phenolica]TMN93568.1 hypothetical protein CWB72_02775 [Pseudoalteromonas phenolica]